MIVCKKCGNHNADADAFCGSCGSFLEWMGERVEQADTTPTVVPTTARPGAPPTMVERVKDLVSDGQAERPAAGAAVASPPPVIGATTASAVASAPPTSQPESAAATGTALPAPPNREQDGPPAASSQANDERTRRAEALIARQPATAVVPEPKQPREVKPEAPKPPRKPVIQPPAKPTIRPGDLICGQCGEGNARERNFCRHCGASLAEAAVAPTPWWRRRPFRRKRVAAGARPMRRQRSSAAWRALRVAKLGLYSILGLVAAVGLVGAIGPWRGGITERAGRVVDRVRLEIKPKVEPVALSALQPVRASSQLPSHEANLAADRQTGTFWSEGVPGAGEGQWLEFFFEEPVDLYKVIIHSGASGEKADEKFEVQPRPKELRLEFRDAAKQVVGTKTLRLENDPKEQTLDVRSKGVSEVTATIVSVHGARPDGRASITEIEFFQRR